MLHIAPVIYVIILATMAGLWKIFEKAGEKGWKAIVPVYNYYVWLKILKRPWWWIFIFLVPGVGFMLMMVVSGLTSAAFGRKKLGQLIISGILFFIYLPYLGFGKLKFNLEENEKKEKKSLAYEWTEAIVFAVIAATIIRTFLLEAFTIPTPSMEKSLMVGDYLFVSKVDYGARIPLTPISVPFVQNALPFTQTTPSYLDWLEYPPLRFPGFTHIKRHDIVVFNFPEGDTVPSNISNPSFYALCRGFGRERVMQNQPLDMDNQRTLGLPGHLLIRPVDKEEPYIKRCIGIPGDTLSVRHAQVYINGKADDVPGESEYKYKVTFNGTISGYNGRPSDPSNPNEGGQFDIDCNNRTVIDKALLNKLDITESMAQMDERSVLFTLTRENAEKFKTLTGVASVVPYLKDSGTYGPEEYDIFPSSTHYKWNVDNFGPLWIPKEGATVKLDTFNLPLYKRIITAYEHNTLEVRNGQIYINGAQANSYTFKMNYYFMMGDNRHNSEDSRYWGFVPFDHVVGKASFIWMSLKKNTPFKQKFRWNRFFTFVNTAGISRSYLIPFLFIVAIAIAYSYIKGIRRAKKE